MEQTVSVAEQDRDNDACPAVVSLDDLLAVEAELTGAKAAALARAAESGLPVSKASS